MPRSNPALLTAAATAGVLFALGAAAPDAHARPLSLDEIHQMGVWLECAEACDPLPALPTYDDHVATETCRAACGATSRHWEKNGVAPIDRDDHWLALLELIDADETLRADLPADTTGQPLICYRDEVAQNTVDAVRADSFWARPPMDNEPHRETLEWEAHILRTRAETLIARSEPDAYLWGPASNLLGP